MSDTITTAGAGGIWRRKSQRSTDFLHSVESEVEAFLQGFQIREWADKGGPLFLWFFSQQAVFREDFFSFPVSSKSLHGFGVSLCFFGQSRI